MKQPQIARISPKQIIEHVHQSQRVVPMNTPSSLESMVSAEFVAAASASA
jgi:hypothetical protein